MRRKEGIGEQDWANRMISASDRGCGGSLGAVVVVGLMVARVFSEILSLFDFSVTADFDGGGGERLWEACCGLYSRVLFLCCAGRVSCGFLAGVFLILLSAY